MNVPYPIGKVRSRRPIILLVAMPDSIHTSRWIAMVRGSWARLVLLPAYHRPPALELEDWSLVRSRAELDQLPESKIGVFDLGSLDRHASLAADEKHRYDRPIPMDRPGLEGLTTPNDVVRAIELIEPDLVHSLEVQLAGYVVFEAKRRLGASRTPPWLLSNWGSDIYLYERVPNHRPALIELLQSVDGYLSECHRDVGIARQLGFRGVTFEPTPASGGQDFAKAPKLSDLPPPSQREVVLIKGYHGWAGRGLHILSAIHLAAPALRRFRIRIMFASPAVLETAALIAAQDGLDIKPALKVERHAEALARMARARMLISMGISDGISTTLLEAMSLGAFPIQGSTSCAGEWVRHGRDAFILDPHDVAGLARAITTAAQDDALVDAAAPRNRATVERKWNSRLNRRKAQSYYQSMLDGSLAGDPVP